MKKICIYLIEWYQKHISKFFVAKNIRCKYDTFLFYNTKAEDCNIK